MAARIAVAATAPFGADVLERLAAGHEISALLTRPDAPRGTRPQGGRAAGEESSPTGSASPCCSRSGPSRARPRRADRRRLRLRAADPGGAARWTALAQRPPSLLPRWRGAAPVERAILAGDAETGVTIHETVKELDAGPIAAQERVPDRRRRTTRARCSSTRRRSRRGCSTGCSPSRRRRSCRRARRRHVRRQDRTRPIGCSTSSAPPTSSCGRSARCRRTSARAPSCTAAP